jgi:broad specificity phosphatase PhoE
VVVKTPGVGLRLYVLRHGEPERRDMFYGHYDIGLSPRGVEQARAQAERLREVPLQAIYSSDLQRAQRGAALVAEGRELRVRIDSDLREMSLGVLEAMPHAEAMERYPQWAGRSYLDMLDVRMPDGGESVRDLSHRVLASVERLALEHAGPATCGHWPTVLMVAHNTVARVLLAMAAGSGVGGYRRFIQRYGAINRIDVPMHDGGQMAGSIDWAAASIGYTNRDPLASVHSER